MEESRILTADKWEIDDELLTASSPNDTDRVSNLTEKMSLRDLLTITVRGWFKGNALSAWPFKMTPKFSTVRYAVHQSAHWRHCSPQKKSEDQMLPQKGDETIHQRDGQTPFINPRLYFSEVKMGHEVKSGVIFK